MVELFANSGDPDQMPLSAASDLGLHHLPISLLGISRLQWINFCFITQKNVQLQTFNKSIQKVVLVFKG